MDPHAIIKRIGGTKKTAEICHVSRPAVSQWTTNGIPRRHWESLILYTTKRQIPGITWDVIQESCVKVETT